MYVPLDITTRTSQRHFGPGVLAVIANAAFIALFALGLGVAPKVSQPKDKPIEYVILPNEPKETPQPIKTTVDQSTLKPVHVPLPNEPNIPIKDDRNVVTSEPYVEPAGDRQTGSVVEPQIAQARILRHSEPAYPPASIRAHEEGTVMLQVLIGPDGRIQDVRLAQSSGFNRLDAAAMKEVRAWRFAPATRGGRAVSMWVNVPVKFELR